MKRARGVLVLVALAGIAACNAIAGIEKPHLVSSAGASGADDTAVGGGGSGGAETQLHCLRNSDCADDRVCLFQQCSFPCAEDRDCTVGARCLNTDLGMACISSNATCAGGCPVGSVCTAGACRNACPKGTECLSDQSCISGTCVGSDADHDTPPKTDGGAGAGGDGGAGGAPDVGNPDCDTEKALRCDGSAQVKRSVCTNGKWVPAEPCASGKLCDTSSANAECTSIVTACVGQKPGAKLCDDLTRTTCGPDLLTVETHACQDSAHCSASTGSTCATCLKDEYACSGSLLQKCNEAHTAFESVSDCMGLPCNATLGMCTKKVCNANQYTCTANKLQKCNADGTAFASEVDCASKICDADGGQCDDCVANTALTCKDGTTKNVCNANGQGSHEVKCSDENAATPACVGKALCRQCTPGDTRCSDKHGYQTCGSDGTWPAAGAGITKCTASACSLGLCIGSCEPDALTCKDKSSYTVCTDTGTAGPQTSCGGKACYMNQCQGSCVPGTQVCDAGTSTPQTCGDQGSYANSGMACALPDTVCSVTNNVASCVNNPSHPVGQSTALDTFTDVSSGMLFGTPILTAKKYYVNKLGVVMPSAAQGAVATCPLVLMVYSDDGSKPGAPGLPLTMVGRSSPYTIVAADLGKALEIGLNSQFSLAAGKYYWLFAQYGCATKVQGKGNNAAYPDLKFVISAPAAPTTFPTTGVSTSPKFIVSHYLVVQDLP